MRSRSTKYLVTVAARHEVQERCLDPLEFAGVCPQGQRPLAVLTLRKGRAVPTYFHAHPAYECSTLTTRLVPSAPGEGAGTGGGSAFQRGREGRVQLFSLSTQLHELWMAWPSPAIAVREWRSEYPIEERAHTSVISQASMVLAQEQKDFQTGES